MYQKHLSEDLKRHLSKLYSGNKTQVKRAHKVEEAILHALSNPLNPDYDKDLPNNYKAIKINSRYRLFFKVIPKHKYLHFVWLNDESCQHKSGDKNDCYQVFRKLYSAGKLPQFNINETRKSKVTHELIYYNNDNGSNKIDWGITKSISPQIRITTKKTEVISTSITLIKSNFGYELDSIPNDKENHHIIILLEDIIGKLNSKDLILEYINWKDHNFNFNDDILKQTSFKLQDKSNEFERWRT